MDSSRDEGLLRKRAREGIETQKRGLTADIFATDRHGDVQQLLDSKGVGLNGEGFGLGQCTLGTCSLDIIET
jgi:hypothetical protein